MNEHEFLETLLSEIKEIAGLMKEVGIRAGLVRLEGLVAGRLSAVDPPMPPERQAGELLAYIEEKWMGRCSKSHTEDDCQGCEDFNDCRAAHEELKMRLGVEE